MKKLTAEKLHRALWKASKAKKFPTVCGLRLGTSAKKHWLRMELENPETLQGLQIAVILLNKQ